MIKLTKGLLRLEEEDAIALNTKPGDRLSLYYICDDGVSEIPVLATPEAVGEKFGILVNKRFDLTLRGAANEELRRYGTEFSVRKLDNYNPPVYELVANIVE